MQALEQQALEQQEVELNEHEHLINALEHLIEVKEKYHKIVVICIEIKRITS